MVALNLFAALLIAIGFFLLKHAAPGGWGWDRTISFRGRVLAAAAGLPMILIGIAVVSR